MLKGHARQQRGTKGLLRVGVVQRGVEPLRPAFLEGDLGRELVADLEARRQARFQGALAQQTACEAVQRLDGRLIELHHRSLAVRPFLLPQAAICGGSFEALADAGSQFAGGSLRERDRRDAAHSRPSAPYERDDAADQAARLARARSRLHDHILIKAFNHCIACGLIGRSDHALPSPSLKAAYAAKRLSPRFCRQCRSRRVGQRFLKSQ